MQANPQNKNQNKNQNNIQNNVVDLRDDTQSLKRARAKLGELHSGLLAVLKEKEERALGEQMSPYVWFNRVSQDPAYSWVRPLTLLMVGIDELLDEENISREQVAEQRKVLRGLFDFEKSQSPFTAAYKALMHESPDVLLAFQGFKSEL